MHPFPHHYAVAAAARPAGAVSLSASGLDTLQSDGPAEFDGPGDKWSPETLLTAALADCFALSFRAVARASRFEWSALEVQVQGTLDSPGRVTQFTHFTTRATLRIPVGGDGARARLLLEKAEKVCLISSSLRAGRTLELEVVSA